MKRIVFTYCLLGIVALSASGVAAERCPDTSMAQPAQLVENEMQRKLIADLISERNFDDSLVVVKSEGIADLDGNFDLICCATTSEWMSDSSRAMLHRKLRRLKFVPAKVNDQNVSVYIGITIVATKSSEGYDSKLLMNKLLSAEIFGSEYSAPQRIRSSFLWPYSRGRREKVWGELSVNVDRFGNASDARVMYWTRGPKYLRGYFVVELEKQCFIPGFASEDAVEMTYAEIFVSR